MAPHAYLGWDSTSHCVSTTEWGAWKREGESRQRWSPEGFPSGETEANMRGRKRVLSGYYSRLVTCGTEHLPRMKLDPESEVHAQEVAKCRSVKKRKESFKE